MKARLLKWVVAVGMGCHHCAVQWLHRLRTPFGLRIHSVDHLTLPCYDLAAAERFYVGLLGARVLMRIDAAFLTRVGRAQDAARGEHLSVVFSGGPRVDLFHHGQGQPPALADHPHTGFAVSPRQLLGWKRLLEAAGVKTVGPHCMGPPGQASLYFNDPSGNHLELTSFGFTGEAPMGAPDMQVIA